MSRHVPLSEAVWILTICNDKTVRCLDFKRSVNRVCRPKQLSLDHVPKLTVWIVQFSAKHP